MSLKEENKQHAGEETALDSEEPEETRQTRYVVHKHHTSQLHYDLRLEMAGILKCWAVPKGPSMNPQDKRLAVLVTDHPLDYAGFEGTIPSGEYGAGQVDIWDSGSWKPLEEYANIQRALDEGLLEFHLEGKKLKGEFRLVAMKHSHTKHSWLLIKARDEFSTDDYYDANEH